MKHWESLLFFLFITFVSFGQNVQVDAQSYTAQELIEDILIGSNCISNINVTNVVGGDFGGTDQSYGYFNGNNSSFPFSEGLVLSTGRLSNVEGPNTSLSDDDANNWGGDQDLENVLNEHNTLNATIIEFDFQSIAEQITFRYIFASEEYQEGNSNTCQYSDLFGFLIRPENEQQYTNIAVVPNTQTPVKVTTVHSGIPGACDPINEAYFGSWNNSNAPINFNGQTAILTATANVERNQTYHVKLVIADEQNYRYDSAVFLEAGSFQLATDLGPDRLIANGTALCEGETYQLIAQEPGNTNTYRWFKDGVELIGETGTTLNVDSEGTYQVEVNINGCILYGDVIIEYTPTPQVNNTTLTQCDTNQDGLSVFNLFDAENDVLAENGTYVTNFYNSLNEANNAINEINTPTAYNNTTPNEIVFARVENQFGCYNVAEVTLNTTYNPISLQPYQTCDDNNNDGYTEFDLNLVEAQIAQSVPANSQIRFYVSEEDAFLNNNPINNAYINTIAYSENMVVKITNNQSCYAVTTIRLDVLDNPYLLPDEETYYCTNSHPQQITLNAGVVNQSGTFNYQWEFNGNDLGLSSENIQINEIGTYTVTVTNSNNCSSTRHIEVLPSNAPTIEDIIVVEASNNNSITILVSGDGNYEYALNNGVFQTSNTFTNLAPGVYNVTINDTNNCGAITVDVSILGFPKFFTPNGDNINDYWIPKGINQQNPNLKISIFNRYGKLLKILDNYEYGWDGTFKGKLLPSDDYWFKTELSNGKTYTGHFTLKR
ncbi:T9SS type B sorting domain-containing protein [Mangrovimonas spongiae]|uniref:Gliding motility-associated C-terminal domain-containing protein n=1 Tax=Mangrovimonas spongiae TaxID=2494697 RepID=A0A3R9UUZ7_9FLAO|nr:choice-of-anchor L domain-containing protein [Mangrovimonas spongiae]RSK40714.1 gliding motility-associated C-terminal domain-containing protein [Mangrovimonas spongiae]